MAGNLHHTAFGGEIALEDDEAACGLERRGPREDDVLPLGFLGERSFLAERLACHRGPVAVQQAALDEPLCEHTRTAGVLVVARDTLATGLEVADERRLFADDVEVVDRERDIKFTRDGDEVQHGVGRATGGAHRADGVFKGFARHDLRRLKACADDVHHELACFTRRRVLLLAHRRHACDFDG